MHEPTTCWAPMWPPSGPGEEATHPPSISEESETAPMEKQPYHETLSAFFTWKFPSLDYGGLKIGVVNLLKDEKPFIEATRLGDRMCFDVYFWAAQVRVEVPFSGKSNQSGAPADAEPSAPAGNAKTRKKNERERRRKKEQQALKAAATATESAAACDEQDTAAGTANVDVPAVESSVAECPVICPAATARPTDSVSPGAENTVFALAPPPGLGPRRIVQGRQQQQHPNANPPPFQPATSGASVPGDLVRVHEQGPISTSHRPGDRPGGTGCVHWQGHPGPEKRLPTNRGSGIAHSGGAAAADSIFPQGGKPHFPNHAERNGTSDPGATHDADPSATLTQSAPTAQVGAGARQRDGKVDSVVLHEAGTTISATQPGVPPSGSANTAQRGSMGPAPVTIKKPIRTPEHWLRPRGKAPATGSPGSGSASSGPGRGAPGREKKGAGKNGGPLTWAAICSETEEGFDWAEDVISTIALPPACLAGRSPVPTDVRSAGKSVPEWRRAARSSTFSR